MQWNYFKVGEAQLKSEALTKRLADANEIKEGL